MIKIFYIISISLFLLPVNIFASWNGPITVVSGGWGKNEDQFGMKSGEVTDYFPKQIWLLPDKIIVNDNQNNRKKVYSLNGDLIETDLYIDIGGGKRSPSKYKIAGEYVIYFDGYLYVYNSYIGKYIKQDVSLSEKTKYDDRPAEIGVNEIVERIQGYTHKVSFVDHEISFLINEELLKAFGLNNNGFLSVVSQTDTTEAIYRIDACGKVLGRMQMPENKKHFVGYAGIEPIDELEVQYGESLIAPNGDIYAWKRAPDTYSILKWEWVDDPSDPKPGPDTPENFNVIPSTQGIYVSWDLAPQDPGCVDSYEIERATSADGIYSPLTTVEKGNKSYNDSTVLQGQDYFYRLRAVADDLYSDFTNPKGGKRE